MISTRLTVAVTVAAAISLASSHVNSVVSQKRAVSDIWSVYSGLQAFAQEHQGRYPTSPGVLGKSPHAPVTKSANEVMIWPTVNQRVELIKKDLSKYYVRGNVPVADPWGGPYLYAVTADAKHFVIVSTGSNRRLESGRHLPAWPSKESRRDTVFVDGVFVSYSDAVSVVPAER